MGTHIPTKLASYPATFIKNSDRKIVISIDEIDAAVQVVVRPRTEVTTLKTMGEKCS